MPAELERGLIMLKPEKGKLDNCIKKLHGICTKHGLTFTFETERYPVNLIIKTSNGFNIDQMSLFKSDDDGLKRQEWSLVFSYIDGDLLYDVSDGFVIEEVVLQKLRTQYKAMHFLFLQQFHRDFVEDNIVESGKASPTTIAVKDDDADNADVVSQEMIQHDEQQEEKNGTI